MYKCCFVVRLRAAAVIIAICDIVWVFIGLYQIIQYFSGPEANANILLQVLNLMALVVLNFVLVASLMLIYAAYKSLYQFLMPWIVVNGLEVSFVIVQTFAVITVRGLDAMYLSMNSLFTAMYIYFGICMLHYYKELREPEEEENEGADE